MAVFYYSAAKQNGETVKGTKESENEKELALKLKSEGLFLLEAKAKKSIWQGQIELGDFMARFRPVSVVDKMFFSRNLSVMINAGLPVTRALDALAEEATNPKFKAVLTDVKNSVTGGKALADSLRPHEKVFGELFINMIEVGETTGKLTLVLKLLANQMKKDYDLKRRVKGAMMYPAIIISVLFLVGTLMMIYVIPSLTEVIRDLGAELPPTTKVIIMISELMTSYALYFLAGLAVFFLAFWKSLKTKLGRELFDRAVLKLPIFGTLIKKFNIARFGRIMAYLITSGIPIVKAFEITEKVLGNTSYKKVMEEASGEIQTGKQIHEILSKHIVLFPPVVIQLVKVGEETGKVSSLLLRLALFFEEDVNETTKNLSTIIEPILMVFIGTAVGFFAVSMLQPIYSSLGNVG